MDPDFDQETGDKVIAHLQAKWVNGCPMCGTRNWELAGFTHLFVKKTLEAILASAPTLPCASVICANCGYTALVNLITAGAVKKNA